MVNSERGMTLLELLVVVAIVAVVALFALPDFVRWRKESLYRQVASELLQVMRQARARAVSRNLEQRVEIEVVNCRYRLMEGNRYSDSTAFDTVIRDWVALPPEVALKKNRACDSMADSSLQFNPTGSSQSGYVCVVEADAPEVCHFRVGVSSSATGRSLIRKD